MPKRLCPSARLRAAVGIALSSFAVTFAHQASAASASWNATATDGNWVTAPGENNWSTGDGTYPGSLTDPTNTDTALFNVASNITAINLNDPLFIGSIAFDATASSYTLSPLDGTDNFFLASGGSISLLSTLTVNNRTERINVPLVLDGNYSFLNNATNTSTNSRDLLNIGGSISAGVSGTSTLTLGGGNTGLNLIAGSIGDGSAGGSLALTKTGAGLWALSGNNTYSGATTVSAGALQIQTPNAFGSTPMITVSGTAEVQIANNITVGGYTITLNGATSANDSFGPLKATGSGTTTWAGNVVLGIDQARFGTTSTNPAATFVIGGVISSGSSTFGPAIRVPNTGGTIEFSGANTYKGNTSIIVGNLVMGATNTLPATTSVVFGNNSNQGFATLNLNGFNQTVAGISLIAADNIPSTITSNDPATLTINGSAAASFGNSTSGLITASISLTKEGAGTLTLQNATPDTYTGPTTVQAGTLLLDASAYASSSSTNVGNLIANSPLVWSGGTLTLKGRANGTATSLTNATYNTTSTNVTVASTAGLIPGQPISGTGIPAGEYVVSITSSTAFVVNAVPTAAGSATTLTATPTSNTTVQNINGTTLMGGALIATLNVNGGTSTTLGFGPINRMTGSTIDLTIPTGGSFTTPTANANFAGGQPTILGGYATVGGSTWAVSAGDGTNPGSITGLPTASYNSGFAAGTDVDAVPASSPLSLGAMTINSLRFNTTPTTGQSYTINPSGLLTIATGGIIVTGSVGGNQVTVNAGGSITSGNGQDLIFILNNSANDVIDSPIVDDGGISIGVTRSGTGSAIYVVNAQSTYSGPTTLNSGVTVAQNSSTGPAGAPSSGPFGTGMLIFDGGQIRPTSNQVTTIANPVTIAADIGFPIGSNFSLTFSGPVTLANGTRTLNTASVGNIIFSGSIGDNGAGYGINKAGTGTIVFSGGNSYGGNTNINAGALLANAPAGNSATGSGAVNVNSTGILAGIGWISGNNAQVTVAGGAKISAGTGTAASSTPGNLTTVGGNGSTSFSQAWVGASTAATAGSYVAKFNPKNLGNAGATIGGSNPTATADPGGPGANWDELTMATLNLVATPTNQFNLATVSLSPGFGTANPFNSNGTYSWPVAIITNGVSGFYINGSSALGGGSQDQAALQAAVAPLLRLDPTGLVAATGVSNTSSFSVGVAPDPNNGSSEDVVINYAPAPEPGSLAMVGLGLGAMMLRRRRQ